MSNISSAMIDHPGTRLLALALLFYLTYVAIVKFGRSRRRLPLPPGPSTAELSPNIPIYLQFHEFSKAYSPVFSVKIGHELFVIVAGYKEALEIMQKHSVYTADRPRYVSGGEIVSNNLRLVFANSGDRFRRLRRALHSQLQPSAAKEYQPLQFEQSKQYMLDLLQDPEHHIEYARKYAASVIMTIVYGKKTPTRYSDPEVIAIELFIKRIVDCVHPGAYLVDRFPFLKYLPTPETRLLRRYHREEMDLYIRQLGVVRQQIANKEDIPPSFAAYLLERQEEYQLSDDELTFLVGEMFGAGSDTTASAISFMTMAAACFPHEQAKVQAQLDAVVGRARLPTFEDQPELPYVTAFMLEAYRWRPVSTGIPHKASKDIVWNNTVIPAGATVIGNHWSILRDPEVFPDPDVFKPDRWLDIHGKIRDDIKIFGFGFGRRVCPGQHVADRSLYITTALLMWSFNISEDPSAPIDTMGFKGGSTAQIHPFKLVIEPRGDNLKQFFD